MRLKTEREGKNDRQEDIQNNITGEETDTMADGNGAATPTAQGTITTPEQLAEMFPDLVRQITASATAAERERIAKIDEAAVPGFESLIAAAKADPNKTAGEVALEIIKAQKDSGRFYLTSRDADVKASNVNDVSAAVTPDAGGEDTVDEANAAAKEAVALWKEGGAS